MCVLFILNIYPKLSYVSFLYFDEGIFSSKLKYVNDNEHDKGINMERISSYMYITANLR